MEYIIVAIAALLASGLTLFSGFGLGTLLVPVFALFFPVDMAIALTAIVHLLNNLFKLSLLGKHADRNIIIRFGLPALVASLLGAFCLVYVSKMQPLYSYTFSDKLFEITIVKLLIGLLMLIFATIEIVPRMADVTFDKRYLTLGGLLSGFFGGLSGNQGALRSMFLIKAGLSKETYIATGVFIACLIDVSRLSIYFNHFKTFGNQINYLLLVVATLSAFLGAYIGTKLMKKITLRTMQLLVAIMLYIIGACLIAGIL